MLRWPSTSQSEGAERAVEERVRERQAKNAPNLFSFLTQRPPYGLWEWARANAAASSFATCFREVTWQAKREVVHVTKSVQFVGRETRPLIDACPDLEATESRSLPLFPTTHVGAHPQPAPYPPGQHALGAAARAGMVIIAANANTPPGQEAKGRRRCKAQGQWRERC